MSMAGPRHGWRRTWRCLGRHALAPTGPLPPAAPREEGHGTAHADLRRSLQEDPGPVPAGRRPRRGDQRHQSPDPAGADRQWDPEAQCRSGHCAGVPGRWFGPCRRRPVPHRTSHLGGDRRGADLRHAVEGLSPHSEHALGLLHPHADRGADQPAQQRRPRRTTGLHRSVVQCRGQPGHGAHRAGDDVLPELADHPGRADPASRLPHPGPHRRAGTSAHSPRRATTSTPR